MNTDRRALSWLTEPVKGVAEIGLVSHVRTVFLYGVRISIAM